MNNLKLASAFLAAALSAASAGDPSTADAASPIPSAEARGVAAAISRLEAAESESPLLEVQMHPHTGALPEAASPASQPPTVAAPRTRTDWSALGAGLSERIRGAAANWEEAADETPAPEVQVSPAAVPERGDQTTEAQPRRRTKHAKAARKAPQPRTDTSTQIRVVEGSRVDALISQHEAKVSLANSSKRVIRQRLTGQGGLYQYELEYRSLGTTESRTYYGSLHRSRFSDGNARQDAQIGLHLKQKQLTELGNHVTSGRIVQLHRDVKFYSFEIDYAPYSRSVSRRLFGDVHRSRLSDAKAKADAVAGLWEETNLLARDGYLVRSSRLIEFNKPDGHAYSYEIVYDPPPAR